MEILESSIARLIVEGEARPPVGLARVVVKQRGQSLQLVSVAACCITTGTACVVERRSSSLQGLLRAS